MVTFSHTHHSRYVTRGHRGGASQLGGRAQHTWPPRAEPREPAAPPPSEAATPGHSHTPTGFRSGFCRRRRARRSGGSRADAGASPQGAGRPDPHSVPHPTAARRALRGLPQASRQPSGLVSSGSGLPEARAGGGCWGASGLATSTHQNNYLHFT